MSHSFSDLLAGWLGQFGRSESSGVQRGRYATLGGPVIAFVVGERTLVRGRTCRCIPSTGRS